MPLTASEAVDQARLLYDYHEGERTQLDIVRRYWKGRQGLPAAVASDSRRIVRMMARSSRVNVLPLVIDSLVQAAFVDGFRAGDNAADLKVWDAWQANRMDARQSAIYRAAAAYGTAYAVVTPGALGGEPMPVIRGVSPRAMCTLYGEDPDWPMWALERLGGGLWRLYDDEAIYHLERNDRSEFTFIDTVEHDLGVAPVVRFLDSEDLDCEDEVEPQPWDLNTVTRGQIAPLMALQDQIDLTTFGLQIAQHFGAFKQRWIIGWVAESEQQLLKAGAAEVMTFDKNPSDMSIGQFDETNLSGYIDSRQASFRHVATLSQTPIHELTGDVIQMSAEALAAAEAGKDRKVGERHTLWGEADEQIFWLCGRFMGIDIPADAEVVWRDTSARSFAATVDALTKLAQSLEVPVDALWERIPGITKQDLERFKKARRDASPITLPGRNGAGATQ